MAYDYQKIQQLVGREIRGYTITADRESMELHTDQGSFLGVCEADCCSYTWIEGVEEPALGFPCTILKAEDLDMPEGAESTFRKDPEVLAFYGTKFTTDKGDFVIDYRNDSNGYYGGSLIWGKI